MFCKVKVNNKSEISIGHGETRSFDLAHISYSGVANFLVTVSFLLALESAATVQGELVVSVQYQGEVHTRMFLVEDNEILSKSWDVERVALAFLGQSTGDECI